jgi:hypothetical protein
MAETWTPVSVAAVRIGDRVRTADGSVLTVSRIEEHFFDRDDLVAFIEDTAERWYKRPVPVDGQVEVLLAD